MRTRLSVLGILGRLLLLIPMAGGVGIFWLIWGIDWFEEWFLTAFFVILIMITLTPLIGLFTLLNYQVFKADCVEFKYALGLLSISKNIVNFNEIMSNGRISVLIIQTEKLKTHSFSSVGITNYQELKNFMIQNYPMDKDLKYKADVKGKKALNIFAILFILWMLIMKLMS